MRSSKILFSLLTTLALVLMLVGCKKNECKDVVCAPCPSSRFVMEYQDSLGNCLPAFHASARVYAISASNPGDTAYSYTFSDSCHVGFLIDESMVYHVVGSAPATNDVLSFEEIEYQEPIAVTECCLCYPVSSVKLRLNGDSAQVSMPVGSYENTAYIRQF